MNSNKYVFVSYAREDEKAAERLYKDLKEAGVEPWFAPESVMPGEDWKRAIKLAIRSSRYFIALLSSNSVNKKGVVQSEIADALEILKEFPPSEIYMIPVRLDDCKPSHERLQDLQWADMFPDWEKGLDKILRSVGIKQEILPDFEFIKYSPAHIGRPLIPVRITNPITQADIRTFALIDTGADICAIPTDFAGILKLDLKSEMRSNVSTAGVILESYLHKVQIEIYDMDGKTSYTSDEILANFITTLKHVIIGKNFLEKFVLTINYPKNIFKLRKIRNSV